MAVGKIDGKLVFAVARTCAENFEIVGTFSSTIPVIFRAAEILLILKISRAMRKIQNLAI